MGKTDLSGIWEKGHYFRLGMGLEKGRKSPERTQNTASQNKGSTHRGSYMSAHVLLNLLNELGKRDRMPGLPIILSLFHNKFNKFNNTGARMLDSFYHILGFKTSTFCHLLCNVLMDVIA